MYSFNLIYEPWNKIMKCYKINKEARTFMPEIMAPGTGLTPPTQKSVVPTNNVHTIQDVLDGRKYKNTGIGSAVQELLTIHPTSDLVGKVIKLRNPSGGICLWSLSSARNFESMMI